MVSTKAPTKNKGTTRVWHNLRETELALKKKIKLFNQKLLGNILCRNQFSMY
jgi:hypothetical protein